MIFFSLYIDRMKHTICSITLLIVCLNGYCQTAKDYTSSGISKINNNDNRGAIEDLNKSIELAPTYEAYYNRGVAKRNLRDIDGAIEDYTKTIELNESFALAYSNRGAC